MSYILDALRRADAERERGAVPGLRAQPVPVIAAETGMGSRRIPWRWIAAGAGIALMLPLAWQWMGREATSAKAPDGQRPSPTAAPAAMPTPGWMANTASATAAATPTPTPTPATAPAPAPIARATPAPVAQPTTASKTTTAVARATPQADARPSAVGQPKTPAATAEQPRVLAYSELPEDVRRQLPRLVFGGSVHSEQAADRILIVNSQLMREGESVAPGVVLEQIKRQSAVFKYGGYRYEMNY